MIQVELEGEFQLEPRCILNRGEISLRNKTISQVKVQWRHFGPDEATWETKDAMKHTYHFLFTDEYGVFALNRTLRVVFL